MSNVVFLKAAPDFIHAHWKDIFQTFYERLELWHNGEESWKAMNNWLAAFLSDKAQLWIGAKIGDSEDVILCYLTTHVDFGGYVGVTALVVDYLVGEHELENQYWKLGLDRLRAYARLRGCEEIVIKTGNARVIERLKASGIDCSTIVATIGVN
jgi:hypothetical protein